MSIKSKRFKVEHSNFKRMRGGFEDCIRYSLAKEIEYSRENNYAIIEIPPVGNPSMRKEGLELYIKRWESFGFKLTEIKEKKCTYYVKKNGCSHLNDMYDLGECIYKNGLITSKAEIHCSQGKKYLGLDK